MTAHKRLLTKFGSAVLVGALAACLVGLGNSASAAPDDKPDLKLSLQLDKWVYAKGDATILTVTVENASKVVAKNVHATTEQAFLNPVNSGVDWVGPATDEKFNPDHTKGFDLAAGEKKTYKLQGRLNETAWIEGMFYVGFGMFADNGEASEFDNSAGTAGRVPGPKQAVTGFLRKDEKGTGPGFGGVRVAIVDPGYGCSVAFATTAADGSYTFNDLFAGLYELQFQLPAGWRMTLIDNASIDGYTVYLQVNVQTDGKQATENVVKPDSRAEAIGSLARPCPADRNPAAAAPDDTRKHLAAQAAGAQAAKGKARQPTSRTKAKATLPVTGSNAVLLGGAGAALVVVGLGVFVAARRRRTIRFVSTD